MVTTRRHWAFAAVWIIVATATLLVAVPSWVSVATFWWLNAAAVAVGAVLVTTLRSAGPTRSIAHVLYDAEQRQTGSNR